MSAMHGRLPALVLTIAALLACGDSGPTESSSPLLETNPASLDFGVLAVDAWSGLLVVTVENAGTAALDEPIVSITGPASADFAVDSSTSSCPGAALAIGATCTLEVSFQPTTGGARDATLEIRGEGTDGVRVSLAGTGAGLVTAERTGTGSGVIASEPSGILCGDACAANFAVPVSLTATPDEGSYFTGWSGACTGTGECVVPVGESATVTAAFAMYPETSLTLVTPLSTNRPLATWTFSGERAAGFECALNFAPYAPCTSPFTTTEFGEDGYATLVVRAIDAAGQRDPTFATARTLLTDTPLLRYVFNGDVLNRGALTGYHGTAGAVTYPAGKFSQAVKFDGTDATGVVLTDTRLVLGADFKWTIGFWFREDVLKTDSRLLAMRGIGEGLGGWETYHGVSSTTQLTTCSDGGCMSFTTPAAGAWHHLLMRYDGESATVGAPMEFYLDGVYVGSIANEGRIPMTAGARDLAFGRDPFYGHPSLFHVDEVRVFNTVFTPAEQCTRAIGGTWTGTSCTLP